MTKKLIVPKHLEKEAQKQMLQALKCSECKRISYLPFDVTVADEDLNPVVYQWCQWCLLDHVASRVKVNTLTPVEKGKVIVQDG